MQLVSRERTRELVHEWGGNSRARPQAPALTTMLATYGFRFGEALFLYDFRHRDPRTGKWIRTRYRAEHSELVARYTEWEIIGEPEVRRPGGASFNPWRPSVAEMPLELQPHLAMPPRIDATERHLLRVFLRRYITYCARRRRFAAMQGAARLFAEC